jgi:phosphoribosyl-AMP cyclohydrolase
MVKEELVSAGTLSSLELLEAVRFGSDGLVPAIVQDGATGRVLMMAWMNRESLTRTIERREAVFWSRSRQALWHKGATSGNIQRVLEIQVDCDGDTLLLIVEPAGPACHTGEYSCFYRAYRPAAQSQQSKNQQETQVQHVEVER